MYPFYFLRIVREVDVEVAVFGADGAVAGCDLLVGEGGGEEDAEADGGAVAVGWVPGFGGGGGVGHGWVDNRNCVCLTC